MQYLAIEIVTGNALRVSKDELNRQDTTCICTIHGLNGVLHVFAEV